MYYVETHARASQRAQADAACAVGAGRPAALSAAAASPRELYQRVGTVVGCALAVAAIALQALRSDVEPLTGHEPVAEFARRCGTRAVTATHGLLATVAPMAATRQLPDGSQAVHRLLHLSRGAVACLEVERTLWDFKRPHVAYRWTFGKAVSTLAAGFAAVFIVFFSTVTLPAATAALVVRSAAARVVVGLLLLLGGTLPLVLMVVAGAQANRALQHTALRQPWSPAPVLRKFSRPHEVRKRGLDKLLCVLVWGFAFMCAVALVIGAHADQTFAVGIALWANDGALCSDLPPSWQPEAVTVTYPRNATSAERDWAACAAIAGECGEQAGGLLAANLAVGMVVLVLAAIIGCCTLPVSLLAECRRHATCHECRQPSVRRARQRGSSASKGGPAAPAMLDPAQPGPSRARGHDTADAYAVLRRQAAEVSGRAQELERKQAQEYSGREVALSPVSRGWVQPVAGSSARRGADVGNGSGAPVQSACGTNRSAGIGAGAGDGTGARYTQDLRAPLLHADRRAD